MLILSKYPLYRLLILGDNKRGVTITSDPSKLVKFLQVKTVLFDTKYHYDGYTLKNLHTVRVGYSLKISMLLFTPGVIKRSRNVVRQTVFFSVIISITSIVLWMQSSAKCCR